MIRDICVVLAIIMEQYTLNIEYRLFIFQCCIFWLMPSNLIHREVFFRGDGWFRDEWQFGYEAIVQWK